jgi:hypothetical protein
MIPGPLGDFFRAFQLVFGAICLVLFVWFIWFAITLYDGGSCLAGNQASCVEFSSLIRMPIDIFRVWF